MRVRFFVDFWWANKITKNATNTARRQKRRSARRNAEAGGEDPRRGTRSDQGQNLGKSSGQETRAGQELEELEGVSSTPCPLARQGAADRYAHSADPTWRLGSLEARWLNFFVFREAWKGEES